MVLPLGPDLTGSVLAEVPYRRGGKGVSYTSYLSPSKKKKKIKGPSESHVQVDQPSCSDIIPL